MNYEQMYKKTRRWIESIYPKLGHKKESLNDVAKEITKNKETAMSFLKSCGIMNANGELADEYKIEQDEQKSAEWSEEDERLCQCLIQDQEEALDKVRNDKYGHSEIISDSKEMYRERIDWLKSLESRVQSQNQRKLSDAMNLEIEFDKCCENYTFDDECEVYTARHFFKLGFELQKGE